MLYTILKKSFKRTKGVDKTYKVIGKLETFGYASSKEQFKDLAKSIWYFTLTDYWQVKLTSFNEHGFTFIYSNNGIDWYKDVYTLKANQEKGGHYV